MKLPKSNAVGLPPQMPVQVIPQPMAAVDVPRPDQGLLDPSTGHEISIIKSGIPGPAEIIPEPNLWPLDAHIVTYNDPNPGGK